MNTKYLSLLLGACALCTAAATSFGAAPASVDSRVAAQNSLFEEYYQSELKAHPERATAYGDYRYNDRLDDYSLAAVADQQARDQTFLSRLDAIPTAGLPEQDVLSHAVLRFTLRQRMENHAFKEYEMPVSQMEGPHVRLADLPLAVPFDTVKQYEDYISRLHQIPRVFTQTQEVLRAGLKDNLMPVRFLIDKVPEQCQGVIDADPFLLPTQKFPAGISADDQQRLTRAITDAVNNEVLPAYRAFAAFIVTDYAPHGRTVLSAASLPGGARRYLNDIHSRTTVSDLSPEQIHRIGLKEIERIQAEMTGIAHKAGFADLAAFRASVEADPKYKPTSAEQIVEVFRQYVDQMQPKLPDPVHLHPRFAGHRRSHAGIPGGQCHSLPNRHSRRQTPRPHRGCRLPLCPAFPDRRRSHRLSRRHSRASHAAVGGTADGRPAQVPPA